MGSEQAIEKEQPSEAPLNAGGDATSQPWYHSSIGDNLVPEMRRLLEEYSRIAPTDVESHIYKVVCSPWLFPFPYH